MSNNFIELRDLSKYYSSKDVVTLGLRKVSLKFDKGEFVAVCGESGSGKSTLMNVISGMDTYEEGEMLFYGEETSCFNAKEWDEYRRQNIAFVFQDYNLIDSYTVLQNVELALLDAFPNKGTRRDRALELIDKVGLSSHKKNKCTKLSGGQKQRVAIARALAKDAPILIADEPTGNLDSETSKSILQLLAELSQDKLLLVVTHSFDDVKEYATRKIRLFDGSVVEDKIVKPKRDIEEKEEFNIVAPKSKGDFVKNIKDMFFVALNNVFATPKKSIFAFSTFFVASLLVLVFMISVSNVIMLSPEESMWGERRDMAIVFYSDRSSLQESDRQALNNVDGIKDTMLVYDAFNNSLQPMEEYIERTGKYWYIDPLRILNIANFSKTKVEYGRLPKNDDEILLSYQAGQTPKIDLIGETIEFIYGSRYIYGFADDGPYNNEISNDDIVLNLKVVGFTTGSNHCYLTTNAIEELSKDVKEYVYNTISFEVFTQEFGYSEYFTMDQILISEEIDENQIYLLVGEGEYSDITSMIPAGGVNVNLNKFTQYYETYEGMNVKVASSDSNQEIFNEYYDGSMKLLLPSYICGLSSNGETSSNAARIILDVGKGAEVTLKKITNEGYKVVYPYNADQGAEYKLLLLGDLVVSFLLGIILGGLASVLLSSILYRVLQTKKKDYNILRILGMSQKNVRNISYLEFIITNVLAYIFLVLIIIVVYTIGYLSSGFKLMNFMNTMFPYGLFHYSSLLIFFIAFVLLMLLTTKISNRFNKKIFNVSIKKSSVDV